MKRMTPRERVMAAVRHEPVDRLPQMLWIEPHTILKMAEEVVRARRPADFLFFKALAAARDAMPNEELRNLVPMAAYLGQSEYLMQLGSDVIGLAWAGSPFFLKKVRIRDGSAIVTDLYGVERGIRGLYVEILKVPCSTPEDLAAYRFPDLSRRVFYDGIRAFRRAHPGVAISAETPGVQDVSQWFMGLENLYLWMALHPDKIKSFFKRLLEHSLDIIRGSVKAGADMVTILDDYGAQGRLLISKAMWEEFTYPCLKRQCEEAHRLGAAVMLHSCGYVEPLLDRIVEAGVDVLQSFQPAAGNDFERAKSEFGGKLCFATGIDSQTLPAMTPEEVRESVLAGVHTGAPGGGYILATNHALQVDTPAENLKMLFRTLKEIRRNKYRDN